MSTGFRLFLLILLVFGAVWISNYREDDIAYLVGAPKGVESILQSIVSRVESQGNSVDTVSGPQLRVVLTSPPEIQTRPVKVEEPPSHPFGRTLWAANPPADEADWDDELEDGEYYEDDGSFDAVYAEDEYAEDPLRENATDSDSQADGEPSEAPHEPEIAEPSTKPEAEASPAPVPLLYTVEPDDNLWKIARNLLGKGSRYKEILKLNDLRAGSVLLPGKKLTIPQR